MTLPSIFLHKPNHWLKHLRMASVYTTTSHKIQAADTDLPIGSWWSFIAWDPSFSRTFLVHLVQLPSFSGPNVISGCSNQHFFMVQKNFQPEINIFSRWLNQHFSGSFHGWYTSPFFQIKNSLRWPGQTFSQAPSIIFIDELDAIGQKRSGGGELSGGAAVGGGALWGFWCDNEGWFSMIWVCLKIMYPSIHWIIIIFPIKIAIWGYTVFSDTPICWTWGSPTYPSPKTRCPIVVSIQP